MENEASPILQSDILSEANPNSIAELMNKDAEGYTRQDRDRIIAALRADRGRRESAERTAAESGGKKKTKAKTPPTTVLSTGDLGI